MLNIPNFKNYTLQSEKHSNKNENFFLNKLNSTKFNETKHTYSSIDNRTTNYRTGFNITTKNENTITSTKENLPTKKTDYENNNKKNDNKIFKINEDMGNEKDKEKIINQSTLNKIPSNKNLRSTITSLKSSLKTNNKLIESNNDLIKLNQSKYNEDKDKEKERFITDNNLNENEKNNSLLDSSKFESRKDINTKLSILNKISKNKQSNNNINETNNANNNGNYNSNKHQTNVSIPLYKKSSKNAFFPKIKNSNQELSNNLDFKKSSSNNFNFNKTFLSTSSSGLDYNPNLKKFSLMRIDNQNGDFFKTQFLDKKSSLLEKRSTFFSTLMSGFKDIERETTDINVNLTESVGLINDDIQKYRKKDKYVKEFNFDVKNENDVFLYGKNGEGYYMSNSKVINESELIKGIKSENVFKHRVFFNNRYNFGKKEENVEVFNSLNKQTEDNFNKVNEYLTEIEEIKLRSIKNIEAYQYKVYMESLMEHKELEDNDEDINY
jgi:hypothetical protein